MYQEFKAVIRQHKNQNAAYVEPPFDVQEVFGAKRVKVKATFDGVEYRGSVVYMGGCYMLGITQEIRAKIGKSFGDEVFVTLQKDVEERTIEIPEELEAELKHNEAAAAAFKALSYSHRKEYILWITSAKREATRAKRIAKTVRLLSESKI